MKHIALAAAIVTLVPLSLAVAAPMPIDLPDGADAAGLARAAAVLPQQDTPAPEPSVELASYFSFMRSFGRICYSNAVGWYYC